MTSASSTAGWRHDSSGSSAATSARSDAVIDDACQFAWACLVAHCQRVRREAALSWLATTAVREALRLLRRDGRDAVARGDVRRGRRRRPRRRLPRDPMSSSSGSSAWRDPLPPVRQQRLLWLQGFGLSYAEIASHEACTTRTVERQLLRAKATLARAGAD